MRVLLPFGHELPCFLPTVKERHLETITYPNFKHQQPFASVSTIAPNHPLLRGANPNQGCIQLSKQHPASTTLLQHQARVVRVALPVVFTFCRSSDLRLFSAARSLPKCFLATAHYDRRMRVTYPDHRGQVRGRIPLHSSACPAECAA